MIIYESVVSTAGALAGAAYALWPFLGLERRKK